MSIPRQLVRSFETITNCELVANKVANEENLKEFGKAINNAIPDTTNQISHMIYKFIRGMYLSDKQKFISHIKSMDHYEAMILWTDYDDILNFFGLSGVIFLGWNKIVNKYQAAKIDLVKTKSILSPPPSKIPMPTFVVKPDVTKISPDLPIIVSKPNQNSNPELLVQNVEQNDDYDVLYNRIEKLQQSLKVVEANVVN